jgi:hypothetical protein
MRDRPRSREEFSVFFDVLSEASLGSECLLTFTRRTDPRDSDLGVWRLNFTNKGHRPIALRAECQ